MILRFSQADEFDDVWQQVDPAVRLQAAVPFNRGSSLSWIISSVVLAQAQPPSSAPKNGPAKRLKASTKQQNLESTKVVAVPSAAAPTVVTTSAQAAPNTVRLVLVMYNDPFFRVTHLTLRGCRLRHLRLLCKRQSYLKKSSKSRRHGTQYVKHVFYFGKMCLRLIALDAFA